MELFVKLLVMLIFVKLKVCQSIPIYPNKDRPNLGSNKLDSASKNPNYIRGAAIICLSWVTLAAIGWGLYYGYRSKENRFKKLESDMSSSYEFLCCTKIPPSKRNENSVSERTDSRFQQPNKVSGCCGGTTLKRSPKEMNSYPVKDNNIKPSSACCAPQNDSRSLPLKQDNSTRAPREPTSCCSPRNRSMSVESKAIDKRNRDIVSRKKQTPCCISGDKSISDDVCKPKSLGQPVPRKKPTQCCLLDDQSRSPEVPKPKSLVQPVAKRKQSTCCLPEDHSKSPDVTEPRSFVHPVDKRKPSTCCLPDDHSKSPDVTEPRSFVDPVAKRKQSTCCLPAGQSKSPDVTEPRSFIHPVARKENADTTCCTPKRQTFSNPNVPPQCQRLEYSPPQYSIQMTRPSSRRKDKCCPCCNEISDDTYERPITTYPYSPRICPENIQTLSKSAPKKAAYDFNHVRNATPSRMIMNDSEIKPQTQEIMYMPLESMKVMRPVSTLPPQVEKSDSIIFSPKPPCSNLMEMIRGQVQPVQGIRPNYILVQPILRLNPKYEESDSRPRDICCSSVAKNKCRQGNITPIISGYNVTGNLRVKGKINEETITIPEDTYDVFP